VYAAVAAALFAAAAAAAAAAATTAGGNDGAADAIDDAIAAVTPGCVEPMPGSKWFAMVMPGTAPSIVMPGIVMLGMDIPPIVPGMVMPAIAIDMPGTIGVTCRPGTLGTPGTTPGIPGMELGTTPGMPGMELGTTPGMPGMELGTTPGMPGMELGTEGTPVTAETVDTPGRPGTLPVTEIGGIIMLWGTAVMAGTGSEPAGPGVTETVRMPCRNWRRSESAWIVPRRFKFSLERVVTRCS
jgi:hypothetical protein